MSRHTKKNHSSRNIKDEDEDEDEVGVKLKVLSNNIKVAHDTCPPYFWNGKTPIGRSDIGVYGQLLDIKVSGVFNNPQTPGRVGKPHISRSF